MKTLEDLFLANIIFDDNDENWEWTGRHSEYFDEPVMIVEGNEVSAREISHILFKGPVPDGCPFFQIEANGEVIRSLKEVFMDKVVIFEDNECWVWEGALNEETGVPVVIIDDKEVDAREISYRVHNGVILS